jgi:hypothetical protein
MGESYSPRPRRVAVIVLSAMLASCGGGGGTGGGGSVSTAPQVSISYSTSTINFQADKPYSPAPASQTIVGTITGSAPTSTLYVIVAESNPQVATVGNFAITGNTTGQATVTPASPSVLLAGSYQETLTVKACLNDPTCATGQIGGSPQTITVNYNIGSSVDADTASPGVVESNVAGKLTLRSQGAAFETGDTVTIGSTVIPSSSVNYYSTSDMVLSYPPLTAGTYPISVSSGGDSVSYSGTLTVVDPTAIPAGFLTYPAGITPTAIQSLQYDAQRQALLVVLATDTGSVLLRYAYSGGTWSSPTSVSIAGLQQVQLSPDGSKLLALILDNEQLSVAELDPVTLDQTADTPLPGSIATLFAQSGVSQNAAFSVANDGNAIVVVNTGFTITPTDETNANAFAFVFGMNSRQFSLMGWSDGMLPLAPVSSGDGNFVAMRDLYNASGGTVSALGGAPLGGPGSSSDLTGDKFVEPNPPSIPPGVYSSVAGAPMGYLPDTYGAVMNSDGTRVYDVENYQFDSSPDLHIFDSSAPATANPTNYPELTPALTLAGDPGITSAVSPLVAISVDSATVFVAGVNGIAVQPVTPE